LVKGAGIGELLAHAGEQFIVNHAQRFLVVYAGGDCPEIYRFLPAIGDAARWPPLDP